MKAAAPSPFIPGRFIPANLRMLGFTNIIYAMVINVVTPASISVLTVVLFSLSLKSFSKIESFSVLFVDFIFTPNYVFIIAWIMISIYFLL